MELKLNVYKGKKIEKTYTADDFTLMTGVCEDIIKLVDIDRLTSGALDDQAMGIEIIKIVVKGFDKFRPFLKDVFEGLTDEEYRRTSIKEVAGVILQIVQYTVGELFNIGGTDSKN